MVGGTSGSGVILLSLLMAAGLEGAAVIATDAVISVATSIIKISVFGVAGVITAQVLAFALLIGAIAIPGAFLAKAFVERMPVHIHTAILDVAVIAGGAGDDFGGGAKFAFEEFSESFETAPNSRNVESRTAAEFVHSGSDMPIPPERMSTIFGSDILATRPIPHRQKRKSVRTAPKSGNRTTGLKRPAGRHAAISISVSFKHRRCASYGWLFAVPVQCRSFRRSARTEDSPKVILRPIFGVLFRWPGSLLL